MPRQLEDEPVGQLSRRSPTRAALELVHPQASQINGCSFCVDSGSKQAKKAGESDERLFAVAAWREAPCPEKAAQ